MLEMYQDLIISALVNIGLIASDSNSLPLQIINFILSLFFLLIFVVALVLIILMILTKHFPPKVRELFASI